MIFLWLRATSFPFKGQAKVICSPYQSIGRRVAGESIRRQRSSENPDYQEMRARGMVDKGD